jgi:hypothetical protein
MSAVTPSKEKAVKGNEEQSADDIESTIKTENMSSIAKQEKTNQVIETPLAGTDGNMMSANKRKRKNSETDLMSTPALSKQVSNRVNGQVGTMALFTTSEKNDIKIHPEPPSWAVTNRVHKLPSVSWDLLDVR